MLKKTQGEKGSSPLVYDKAKQHEHMQMQNIGNHSHIHIVKGNKVNKSTRGSGLARDEDGSTMMELHNLLPFRSAHCTRDNEQEDLSYAAH